MSKQEFRWKHLRGGDFEVDSLISPENKAELFRERIQIISACDKTRAVHYTVQPEAYFRRSKAITSPFYTRPVSSRLALKYQLQNRPIHL